MHGARALHFPIRLRCADIADLLGSAGLEEALARALGRQFANARKLLVADAEDRVALGAPMVTKGTIGPGDAAALLARIRNAIGRAADAQGLRRAPVMRTPAIGGTAMQDGPSEPFDPQRFDPRTAEYELPSYDGGKKKVPTTTPVEALTAIGVRLTGVIRLVRELLTAQRSLAYINNTRESVLLTLSRELDDLDAERTATEIVISVLDGRRAAEDVPDGERVMADRVTRVYYTSGVAFPDPRKIAVRLAQLERGALLTNVIRVRVDELDSVGATESEAVRDSFLDVGSFYLELLTILTSEVDERKAFLDQFYTDNNVIRAFAVVRYVRNTLPMLWENLKFSSEYVLGDIEKTPYLGLGVNPWAEQTINLAIALQNLVNDQQGDSIYGDLPSEQSELRSFPDPELTGRLSAGILHLQVLVAALRLLHWADNLFTALGGEPYVGRSIRSGDEDRDAWTAELNQLRADLKAEFRRGKHPDFEANSAKWEEQLKRLHHSIYKELRNLAIRRMIGEQLPFLIVSTAVGVGIAAWVAEISAGARWLVVLAEATTFTVINTAGVYAAGQKPTVGGVALQFGTNLVFAGLGQVFQALGRGAGALQGLSNARRLLLVTSLKAGAFGATTLLQTTIQSIETDAKAKGGESSFGEMLTINLIMNGFAHLFGAAFQIDRGSTLGKALALPTPKDLAAQYTAKGTPIDEQAAADWLDLTKRTGEFQACYQRLAKTAQRGTLTEAEFEAWRKEGLDLADELARKLPRLAAVLGSRSTPAEIEAYFKDLHAYLVAMVYTSPVRLLPEYTGLTQVGDGPTWTYAPANPPERLPALIKALRDRGLNVRELPGGGWEAKDAQEKVVLQALPAGPETRAALPVSLDELMTGPLAQEGLSKARAQIAAPELPAQLAQAAQRNRNAVQRLLQILARGDATKNDAVWRGISNYLKAGGNPRALAFIASFEGDRTGGYAAGVFAQVATWDAATIAGLETILEIRPQTTRAEIGAFLGDYGPEAVKDILRDIHAVRPAAREAGLRRVIGQLLVEFVPPQRARPSQVAASASMRGARGVLTTALELMTRFPGKQIDFEVPGLTPSGALRIEDIVVVDPTTGERIIGFEVKEVTSAFFGRRGIKQFAADMARDAAARARFADFGVLSRPFETFRLRVRRFEIEAQATTALKAAGKTNPTPEEVDTQMRVMVRDGLKAAFDDPEFLALPQSVRDEYRQTFDSDPSFVEFF